MVIKGNQVIDFAIQKVIFVFLLFTCTYVHVLNWYNLEEWIT